MKFSDAALDRRHQSIRDSRHEVRSLAGAWDRLEQIHEEGFYAVVVPLS